MGQFGNYRMSDVSGLKRNLIFVGQLDDEGHVVTFTGGVGSY